MAHRRTANVPKFRRYGPGKDSLNADAFWGQLMLQRETEGEDIGLAAAIHALEKFRCNAGDGRDIYDRACTTRNKSRRDGVGQTRERKRPYPRIIDQQGMLASLFRASSTREISALLLRSAASTSTERPVIAASCQAVGVDSPNSSPRAAEEEASLAGEKMA